MLPYVLLCRVEQTAAVARWASKAANSLVGGLAWLGGKVAGGVLWAVGADKPLAPGEEAGAPARARQSQPFSAAGTAWRSLDTCSIWQALPAGWLLA